MYLFEPLTDVRCRVGEGPTWCPERGELWWVDLPRGAWYRYVWATGSVDSRTLSDRLSFVAPDDAGGAIAGIADGLAAVPDTGPIATADLPVEAGLESTFVNDGKVGPDRRLYFGTFDRLRRDGVCGLYRTGDTVGAVERVVSGLTISNGLDWSPDGSTMYVVDSQHQHVLAFAFDSGSGSLTARRVLITIPADQGMPDGLAVDADGDIWLALYGGSALGRFGATGVLREMVKLPVTCPASLCFAGPQLDTLVVTTAYARIVDHGREPGPLDGAVLRARVGVRGQRPRSARVPVRPVPVRPLPFAKPSDVPRS